ncbi:MAG: DUF349 domain-containing protein [Flavobacteriales bacterium]|nr:DUF349 domain-containing protein [Flavobacteriales bacterium]MBL6872805.1 DUF349 domain-containing protein [Flavobacteriales bacterium]
MSLKKTENTNEEVISDEVTNEITTPLKDYSELTLDEIINEVNELNKSEDVFSNAKTVDIIKSVFYKKVNSEKEQKKSDFIADGGVEEEFSYTHPLEKEFKNLLNNFKKKKNDLREKIESDYIKNHKIKTAIIEDIEALINTEETLKDTFEKFKALQEKWRNTGEVSIGYRNEIWKSYHYQVERFYDYVKINNELRDLDFNKNYEKKLQICEATEALLNEKSINKIHNELQELHQKWKEIGPVKRELREEMWERFKNASRELHKKRNDHYVELKERGTQAFKNKQEICQQINELTNESADNHSRWNKLTEKVQELELKWKKEGGLNKEDNKEAWKTLRESLSLFYAKKNEFYKTKKVENKEIVNAKTKLCEKAEELIQSDNIDWKHHSQQFIKLQDDWKKSGHLPKSLSDKLWNRFKKAVNTFYKNKKAFFADLDKEKAGNLKLKEELLEKVRAYNLTDDNSSNFESLKLFQKEWYAIGSVPRDNFEIENTFKKTIDGFYSKMKVDKKELENVRFNSKLDRLKENSSPLALDKEKQFLKTKINDLQKEINQYETNVAFFGNSKGADKLKQQVLKKIQNGYDSIEELKAKIKLINSI